ncbi:MAG: hypothetical protein K2Y20_13270 [Sphingomonas sp.]|nr:hypothetical protein [Sphingomonas sp.]
MTSITTDTATFCLFDLECLRHRKDDAGDWWSIHADKIVEINKGNIIICDLGSDGTYDVIFSDQDIETDHRYNFKTKTGNVYYGPGEEISGGGFEPNGSWGGGFIYLEPGNHICSIKKDLDKIVVHVTAGGTGRNNITELIRI